jgi:GT2 family glycosyltransferase
MTKKILLSVILVNYNDKPHLKECLESLNKTNQDLDIEIIVVDNNSEDGSREYIESEFPHVRLISNDKNLGYPRANNQGIKASSGSYLLLLNTDTVVNPGSLSLLREEMDKNRQVGAIGPALFHGDNKFQVSFGGRRTFFRELIQKYFLNHYYPLKLKFSQKRKEVAWVGGACLFLRRDVLEVAGLFDESFFLYFEDIDLCYRIRKHGWKILYLPRVRIYHKGGASTGKRKIFSRFHYRKSQLYFYKKHNSRLSLMLLRLYLRIHFMLLFVLCVLKGKNDKKTHRKFFELLRNNKRHE